MCVRVDCPTCAKPTFAGCGAHIEMVLADVPPPDRCQCRSKSSQPQSKQNNRFRRARK